MITKRSIVNESTVRRGNRAESAAANYLKQNGFAVLEQNFRCRYCEIDIVATKDDCIYFVEVKYRSDDHHGSGLSYIGPQKLHRMTRAAAVWVTRHRWDGEYTLSAIEVFGAMQIGTFIESITD